MPWILLQTKKKLIWLKITLKVSKLVTWMLTKMVPGKGSSLYYVRTYLGVGGWSKNGNFPLLYVVKMSLRRWVGGSNSLKTPLRNIRMAPYKTIEFYLNASLGNCEIWFLPKSKERKYSNPSTESVVNFVNSQPFKLSLFKLFNFVNGLPEIWSNFYQILEKLKNEMSKIQIFFL